VKDENVSAETPEAIAAWEAYRTAPATLADIEGSALRNAWFDGRAFGLVEGAMLVALPDGAAYAHGIAAGRAEERERCASERPRGSNADEWHLFLCERLDNRANHPDGLTFAAVQIAEALNQRDQEWRAAILARGYPRGTVEDIALNDRWRTGFFPEAAAAELLRAARAAKTPQGVEETLMQKRARTREEERQRCVNAAHAHTNLNVFASIISLLEGGHVYGPGAGSAQRTADKIIALCKAETARQLAIYDEACNR
jgi:hypothetical protein